ncbi:MAG: metallophosphoesterase [Candidatus Woesebacteria bacterium]|jgi:predicted phosphodiesterase
MAICILIVGDIHSDIGHLAYLSDVAKYHNCTQIVQLGDFNYMEHFDWGREFLDQTEEILAQNGQTLVFILGNHSNKGLLYARYCDAPKSVNGLWQIRNHLFFAPNAHCWNIDGVKIAALGGAYSVDRDQKIKLEQSNDQPRTLWWPDEETTDDEVADVIAKGGADILLTHDQPRSANLGIELKSDVNCLPNRDRIDRALRGIRPKIVLHGHLHYPYQSFVPIGDKDGNLNWCQVIGLGANMAAAPPNLDYNIEDSWLILTINNGKFKISNPPPAIC